MSTEPSPCAAAGEDRVRTVAVCADLDDIGVESRLADLAERGHRILRLSGGDRDTIIAEAGQAEALMLGYGVVDDGVLAALPRLRLISLAAMGYDNVDIEAASRRDVTVANVSGAATEEVATHALALILDALRGVSRFDRAVRDGVWDLSSSPMPARPSALTLGVLGVGRIGAALVERARPLFGSVIGHDPFLADERVQAAGADPRSFDDVVACADVLSLHLPLTSETEGLFGRETFERMRRGAVVVNVSRGALIDSAALRAALDSGQIGAAGLDVLDVEPPLLDHPLVGHPRVTITPHAGFLSNAALDDYVRVQVENVIAWAETGHPLSPVLALR